MVAACNVPARSRRQGSRRVGRLRVGASCSRSASSSWRPSSRPPRARYVDGLPSSARAAPCSSAPISGAPGAERALARAVGRRVSPRDGGEQRHVESLSRGPSPRSAQAGLLPDRSPSRPRSGRSAPCRWSARARRRRAGPRPGPSCRSARGRWPGCSSRRSPHRGVVREPAGAGLPDRGGHRRQNWTVMGADALALSLGSLAGGPRRVAGRPILRRGAGAPEADLGVVRLDRGEPAPGGRPSRRRPGGTAPPAWRGRSGSRSRRTSDRTPAGRSTRSACTAGPDRPWGRASLRWTPDR